MNKMVLSKSRKEKNFKKYYIWVDDIAYLIVKTTSNGENMVKKQEFFRSEVSFEH